MKKSLLYFGVGEKRYYNEFFIAHPAEMVRM